MTNKLETFTKQLSEKKVEHTKIGRKYYQINSQQQKIIDSIDREPFSAGLFLGEEKKDLFKASLALLEIIAKDSDTKVFVNDKAEWLFLCGRNILPESITKKIAKKGTVLIQNERDENLGLGKYENDGTITNLIDRGDFLRREK
ncbi:hypothetical protein GOV04_04880 [Candidatus Woesearchaeota archaeon]|nr:hypothetical protein [Candidatus Woesearchaeota archaeon]